MSDIHLGSLTFRIKNKIAEAQKSIRQKNEMLINQLIGAEIRTICDSCTLPHLLSFLNIDVCLTTGVRKMGHYNLLILYCRVLETHHSCWEIFVKIIGMLVGRPTITIWQPVSIIV